MTPQPLSVTVTNENTAFSKVVVAPVPLWGSATGSGSGAPADWASIEGKPSSFTPSAHTHPASQISDSTITGRAVLTASNEAAARTAIGAAATSHQHSISDVQDLQSSLSAKANLTHSHTIAQVTDLANQLASKANSTHSHAISQVDGLSSELASKANLTHSHTIAQVTDLANQLASKAALNHDHSIANVVGLADELNSKASASTVTALQTSVQGKADASHSHPLTSLQQSGASTGQVIKWDGTKWAPAVDVTGSGTTGAVTSVAGRTDDVVLEISDIGDLSTQLAGKAATTHSHPISQITDLSTQLANKAAATHSHPISQITNLSTQLADKAPLTHTHPISQITDLSTQLANKAAATHLHTLSNITDYTDLYQSSVPDSTNSVVVGGAVSAPASTWKARTISQSLDAILFPTVAPTVSLQKSVTLTVSGSSGVLEVGQQVSRTITATFNRGRITNGSGVQGPELVGHATSFAYSGTGLSTTQTTTTANTTTLVDTRSIGTIAVIAGPNNWQVTVSHTAGSGSYTDNKNVASTSLDSQRVAGTVMDSASSPAITGVYPWYHLRSPVAFTPAQFSAAIGAGNATNIHPSASLVKVVADASGTLSVPLNISALFLGVAYEVDATQKTKYYVTDLNQGDITLVFSTAQTMSNVTTSLWTRSYKCHITPTALTNSSATIQLRNT